MLNITKSKRLLIQYFKYEVTDSDVRSNLLISIIAEKLLRKLMLGGLCCFLLLVLLCCDVAFFLIKYVSIHFYSNTKRYFSAHHKIYCFWKIEKLRNWKFDFLVSIIFRYFLNKFLVITIQHFYCIISK